MVLSVTFEHVVRQTCNQRASLHKLIIGKSIVITDRCLVALRITEHFSMSRLVTRWTALRPRLPVASVLAMPKLPQLTYRPRTLSTKPKPSECERSTSRWPKLSQLTHRSRTLPVKPKSSGFTEQHPKFPQFTQRPRTLAVKPKPSELRSTFPWLFMATLLLVAVCIVVSIAVDPILGLFIGLVYAIILW